MDPGVSDCDDCIEIDVFVYLRVDRMCNLRKDVEWCSPVAERTEKVGCRS